MSSKIVEIMSRPDTDVMKRLFVEAGGSYQGVADLLGPEVTRGIVANWFQRDQVPAEHVIDLCQSIDGKIKPEELRPDVFK